MLGFSDSLLSLSGLAQTYWLTLACSVRLQRIYIPACLRRKQASCRRLLKTLNLCLKRFCSRSRVIPISPPVQIAPLERQNTTRETPTSLIWEAVFRESAATPTALLGASSPWQSPIRVVTQPCTFSRVAISMPHPYNYLTG